MPISVNGFTVTLADRVKETTQTIGTGTYSLDGATTGFRTFLAGVGNGTQTIYTAVLGANWEFGIGTVTSGAPTTLSRDSILSSSNGGSAVSWGTGIKDIFCDAASALLHQIWPRPNALPAMFVDSRARQTAAGATSYGFTSIASDVRQITVTLDSWRSGTTGNNSALLIQLGTSGGYVGTGYASRCAGINSVLGSGYLQSTSGFLITVGSSVLANYHGSVIISRHGSGTDRWVCQSCIMEDSSMLYAAGSVAISTPDRVRIIAANGTDTFSVGAIGCDIFYGTP